MKYPDRDELFLLKLCIHDSEGEPLYVVADNFEQAEQRYRQWNGREDPEQAVQIESISRAGYLIKHDFAGEAEQSPAAVSR
jgi:hypothetical protein